MAKVYWKVVRGRRDKYYSAIMHGENIDVQYLENEWVTPRFGACFIFDTKDHARALAGLNGLPIRKCHAKNVRKPPNDLMARWMHSENFESFWAGTLTDRDMDLSEIWQGTLFADAVKLLLDK